MPVQLPIQFMSRCIFMVTADYFYQQTHQPRQQKDEIECVYTKKIGSEESGEGRGGVGHGTCSYPLAIFVHCRCNGAETETMTS